MPDLAHRTATEERLARLAKSLLEQQNRRLRERLAELDAQAAATEEEKKRRFLLWWPSFLEDGAWLTWQTGLAVGLTFGVADIVSRSQRRFARTLADFTPRASDLDEAALRYATNRAGDVARGIVRTTLERFTRQVETGLRNGDTYDHLRRRLTDAQGWLFGADRADQIGVTETTAAHSAAERGVVDLHNRFTGRILLAHWVTERDERVCPICRPLDGQPEYLWRERFVLGPPAHARCRCYMEWREADTG